MIFFFFEKTTGYFLSDRKRNDEILEQLKLEPADEKLRRYKSNWLRHVTRMKSNRISKIILNYGPNGGRRLERTLKRLLDEAETDISRHNL